MRDSKTTLEVLHRVRALGLAKTEVANDIGLHRNTVYKVCRDYADLTVEEITRIYEQNSMGAVSQIELDRLFFHHMKGKLSSLDKETIEKCCRLHLNCYLSKTDLAKKLCKKRSIPFELVQDYNPEAEDIKESPNKATLVSQIYAILHYDHAPKNFQEVYWEVYCKTDRFWDNEISYSTFYSYAKTFWIDEKWEHNLGWYIGMKK